MEPIRPKSKDKPKTQPAVKKVPKVGPAKPQGLPSKVTQTPQAPQPTTAPQQPVQTIPVPHSRVSRVHRPSGAENSLPNQARAERLKDIAIIKKAKSTPDVAQEGPIDFGAVVNLSLDAEHTNLKPSDSPQSFPVMVSVKALDMDLGKQRAGLDVVIMIDISSSMSGEKIKLVVETLLFIIDEMQETDRLCLIAFDDRSEILTSLTPMTTPNKEEFKKIVVKKIKTRGSTNIRAALVDCFDVLLSRIHVNEVTAAFLLSDGEDTCGNNIDTFKKTLNEYDVKMKAKGMNYRVNSFGYGEGHDEQVLAMIANFREGNFYYIKNVQLVDECFIDCMGYLMSVFGSQAEVALYMSDKAKIVKKYGNNWGTDATPGKATLRIGNLAIGKERNFVIEVEVPPTEGLEGLKVCGAILNFIAEGQNYMKEAALNLAISAELSPSNQSVVQNVIRLQAADTLRDAEADAKKGNLVQAKNKIRAFKSAALGKLHAKEEQDQFEALLADDIFENQKDLFENRDILEAQASKPSKACFSKSNVMQEKMLRKKKAM